MKRLEELNNRINAIAQKVEDAIAEYSTKELTGGANGYPEPYRGVLLIASDPEEVKDLNELSHFLTNEVEAIKDELENLIDSYEIDDDSKSKAEDLLYDLQDVEISASRAEWRDGWGYANCYDIRDVEIKPLNDVVDVNIIETIGDLFYARFADEVAEDMGLEWEDLKKKAEKRSMDVMDWICEIGNGHFQEDIEGLEITHVAVEHGDMEPDNPELEYEIFETREESKVFAEQQVVDCPPKYDNKNYAVGLRVFGFTADLYDRLNMGGGIAGHEETVTTGLNVPKYKK